MRENTNSYNLISSALVTQFDQKTDHRLLFRKLGVSAMDIKQNQSCFQLDLFMDYKALDREKRIRGAMLEIRKRYGKNALVKGINLLDGATMMERNEQIGGHKA